MLNEEQLRHRQDRRLKEDTYKSSVLHVECVECSTTGEVGAYLEEDDWGICDECQGEGYVVRKNHGNAAD